ncbi:outer membrane protein [Hephaestia sp. GCM10023244]|uniref:outer membrane protein n=1 Tax=unclassified Hephaestia TaxID=2631281 RepID=UPI0020778037|nr:outer membrane beta-barrel protein [Hephaestia sp. MAHUQ-44]MCM8731080.1 outer membrane beta-barrel protein [Hephaestia sp. MAHUQ-44]
MRKLLLTALAATTAAGGFAAPALAQDATFTGPRIGVIAGYDVMRPGSTEDSDIAGKNESANGLLYGVDAGYDIGVGNAVIGAEAEISGSTAKVKNGPVDTNDFGYGRVKAGRDLYIGARAGFRAGPSTLVYAKGGYTNQRLDLTASDGQTETGRHYNLDGYRVGAGVEQAVGTNAYAKLEYRYSNYGKARLEFADGTNTNNFSVDTDRHQVVAGVGLRF